MGRALLVDETTQMTHRPSNDAAPSKWESMSWSEYLLARGFLLPEGFSTASSEEQDAATQYLSSYLTYPLTLAYQWQTNVFSMENLRAAFSDDLVDASFKVCIVGADSEVHYPEVWNELVALVGRPFTLEFVGPRIKEKPAMQYISWSGDKKRLSIQQRKSSIENVVFVNGDSGFDLFAAFQPGPGTNQKYSWEEGFDTIRDTGKPLLLTAYDERDADRDAYWWQYTFQESMSPYKANPWASAYGSGGIPESPLNGVVALRT